MNKKWIFIGVGIVTVLLLTVLIVTLVVVLRPEEWILLEKTFASEDEWCTPDWTLSSDRHRRRCRVPLICEPRRDGVRDYPSDYGYCRSPQSGVEGSGCATSPFLCGTGLACESATKTCQPLRRVGDSCTQQDGALCESGVCDFAADANIDGSPLGGRHSLARYCVAKHLPLGESCDRFRHCITDCLQCSRGTCAEAVSPMQLNEMLNEQQNLLALPMAVNGFSADGRHSEREEASDQSTLKPSDHSISDATQSSSHGLQRGHVDELSFQRHPAEANGEQMKEDETEQTANSSKKVDEDPNSLEESKIRSAWEDRAAEVSALLGERLTAEELAQFFAIPRDINGDPLGGSDLSNSTPGSAIDGQQTAQQPSQDESSQTLDIQQLQQQQPRPVLNGSLAKRLAKLFAGVSFAFTPEDQQRSGSFGMGGPYFGFPMASPPPLPPLSPTMASSTLQLPQSWPQGGVQPRAESATDSSKPTPQVQPSQNQQYDQLLQLLQQQQQQQILQMQRLQQQRESSDFSNGGTLLSPSVQNQTNGLPSTLPPSVLQQLQLQSFQASNQASVGDVGTSSFRHDLVAMSASEESGEEAESTMSREEHAPANTTENSGELEGMFYSSTGSVLQPPASLLAKSPSPMRSAAPSRLQAFPLRQAALGSVPLSANPSLGSSVVNAQQRVPLASLALPSTSTGVATGAVPLNHGPASPSNPLPLPTPALPPPLSPPLSNGGIAPPIGGVLSPPRLGYGERSPCWNDRCCGLRHYCSYLRRDRGCIPRKAEGESCDGDSLRECGEFLSCVGGVCSPWFSARNVFTGEVIKITGNTDKYTVCAPWQQFIEKAEGLRPPHLASQGSPTAPPPSWIGGPRPLGSTVDCDERRAAVQTVGHCVALDGMPCATDKECMGLGGLGFCDVRSKKCRSPAYEACLQLVKELYGCFWEDGLSQSGSGFGDCQVGYPSRSTQFLLQQLPVSKHHFASKCTQDYVQRKRAEFLRCAQQQNFTLERIIHID